MRLIGNFFNLFYSAWAFFVFFSVVPFAIVFYLLTSGLPEKKRIIAIFKMHRKWIAVWERLTGIHFEVRGRENCKPDQTYIFVVNHQNLLDILIAGSCLIHYWKALGKLTLSKIPFIGYLFRTMTIAVDRSNKESRKKSMDLMISSVQKGLSILIFPEGTRNRTNKPLTPFYMGAFRLAALSKVPVLPLVITHTRSLQPSGSLRFYPGKAYFHILEPIQVGEKSEEDLREEVWQIMHQEITTKDPQWNPTLVKKEGL